MEQKFSPDSYVSDLNEYIKFKNLSLELYKERQSLKSRRATDELRGFDSQYGELVKGWESMIEHAKIERAKLEFDLLSDVDILKKMLENMNQHILDGRQFVTYGEIMEDAKLKTINEWVQRKCNINYGKARLRVIWMTGGYCQHCGGTFKGWITQKCSKCGKEKDY